MEMIVVLGIFFIIVTAIFIAIAFFLPEWLGITGAKAKKVIESHTENSLPEDTLQSASDKSEKKS